MTALPESCTHSEKKLADASKPLMMLPPALDAEARSLHGEVSSLGAGAMLTAPMFPQTSAGEGLVVVFD
eukprot:4615644-Amphidinium_carterae.2